MHEIEDEVKKRTLKFTKVGLVCSGGATKAAAFHVGVCLALRDKGFSFVGGLSEVPAPPNSCPYPPPRLHPHQIQTYVGSSAGALIVGMLSAGLSVESIINSFSHDAQFNAPGEHQEIPRIKYRDILRPNLINLKSFLKSFEKSSLLGDTLESTFLKNLRYPGFFSTRGLGGYLKKHILPSNRFSDLKADLFIVGTQLDHSRKILFSRYSTEKAHDGYSQYASSVSISDAIAASMTLPPIFAPYLIEHDDGKSRYYIDGEIRETLSSHVARDNGCDLIINSYTHQPYHYNEETGSLYNYGIPAIAIQAIYQSIEQKIYRSKKSHRQKRQTMKAVEAFFKAKDYPEDDMHELMQLLSKKIDFNPKLNQIFIHPDATDNEMFFGEHFTLNQKTLQNVVTIGYKRAMAELRKYELMADT